MPNGHRTTTADIQTSFCNIKQLRSLYSNYGSENYTLELEDEFGNVTKIGTVDTNGNVNLNDDNTFIDLQGRRVTQPVKGQIYIHKGQKIYFK